MAKTTFPSSSNLLLDTHTLLWFLNGSPELSLSARIAIEAEANTKFVSIASLWEIAIKVSLKKLEITFGLGKLQDFILQNGFEILPVTFEHTLQVSSLEFIHRDPFDRILIAQTLSEKMTLVTSDENIAKYPIKTLW